MRPRACERQVRQKMVTGAGKGPVSDLPLSCLCPASVKEAKIRGGVFSGTRVTSDIETSWLFLTVLLEKMFQYRYFYDSPKTLMVQFPEVARGFRRLLRMKHKSCSSIASQLVPGPGGLPHPRLPNLTEAMTLCLSCWLAYDPLVNPTDPDSLRTHRGVLQILSHCAPYLGDEQLDFYRDCEALYHQMIHAEVTALD